MLYVTCSFLFEEFADLSQPSHVKQLTSWERSHLRNQSALLNEFPNFPKRWEMCFLIFPGGYAPTHDLFCTFQPPQKRYHTLPYFEAISSSSNHFPEASGSWKFRIRRLLKEIGRRIHEALRTWAFPRRKWIVKRRRFAHLQAESNSIWWNLMNKTLKTYPDAQWGWPIYLHLGSW